MGASLMPRAIFLDRDGVIIQNQPDYVRGWSDVVLFPQAAQALRLLKDTSYQIVIVTNQAAVGKGLVQREVVDEINQRLFSEIHALGGRVDRVYVCPHTAEMHCPCRKPKPGLILQAADELEIDLSQSILIGDALSDLQAGHSAGIQQLILVKTGLGIEQLPRIEEAFSQPFTVRGDLLEAVRSLLPNPQPDSLTPG